MERGASGSVRARVFCLFALGYFVSYLYRGVNIGFAPMITHDVGLGTGDLGLLTSLYFLGFAAAQIPAGVLLDRYGARRTNAALLVVAAAGIGLFGSSTGLPAMMLGRLLIGAGVSVCFGGACKAIAAHFPIERLPLLYSLVLTVGALGGVLVGAPLQWLLADVSWRGVCAGLVVFTLAVAALLMLGTPQTPEAERHASLGALLRGTGEVLGSRFFWTVAPFSVATQGVFYAAQSLWVGAYMRDVEGLDAARAGLLVSILGVAMMAGSFVFGLAARRAERLGLSLAHFTGLGMAAFVLDQALIVADAPLPPLLLWSAYGFFGGVGILTYAVLTQDAAPAMVGRVNTSFTLVLFVAIFAIQAGIGLALGFWPGQGGGHLSAGHPAAAHRVVWGVLAAVQLFTAVPYLRLSRASSSRVVQSAP